LHHHWVLILCLAPPSGAHPLHGATIWHFFQALHCCLALIPGIAPPSGANSQHCAILGHFFQALHHCLALIPSIAPPSGADSQHCAIFGRFFQALCCHLAPTLSIVLPYGASFSKHRAAAWHQFSASSSIVAPSCTASSLLPADAFQASLRLHVLPQAFCQQMLLCIIAPSACAASSSRGSNQLHIFAPKNYRSRRASKLHIFAPAYCRSHIVGEQVAYFCTGKLP
jgi:hypothetical protein